LSAAVNESVKRVRDKFAGRRVYVAGHTGMAGSALVRALEPVSAELVVRSSTELDLRNQAATNEFFQAERPEIVLFAAGRVGGIQANVNAPAEFMYDNLAMAANAIHSAYESACERFVYLGSTCVYPRLAEQPMRESALLTSELESTNEGYAIAKIAGLKLCQMYRRQYGVLFHSVMPTNMYGPGDNYHPSRSHVLASLLRRFHDAKEERNPTVTIWGTGRPLREFLHVDDLASAVLHVAALNNPPDVINIGSGDEVSIWDLARMIADVVGFTGDILTDATHPDGTPRKLADSSLLRSTGWRPQIPLRQGLERTYQTFLEEREFGLMRSK
jgi:GDP-L-fucose synthase